MQKYLTPSKNSYQVLYNAPLKDYCTMRVGGRAKILVKIYDVRYLVKICRYCIKNDIKYKIIGLGANIIFSDNYYDGIIIVNQSKNIRVRKNCIYVDSGVNISSLISFAKTKQLGGLEDLAGIPSTIGGAVVNSLSSWGTNFSDLVEYVECYHVSDLSKLVKLHHSKCMFGYRTSIFKSNEYIINRVKLSLSDRDILTIQQNIQSALMKKSKTQPLDFPSAGSVFVRNGDIMPAKLIDEAGLKGTNIGDAMISTKHAGFIINTGKATSQNILDLVEYTSSKILSLHNIKLRLEIEFVNFS